VRNDHADENRQPIGPVRRQTTPSSMFSPPLSTKVCAHCGGRLSRTAAWCPTCQKSTLYVIDEAGDPAGFFRMLAREWIGKPISMVVFCLGYVWILIDQDNQGWHDKLVDTYVVED
jgi:hypothetical protein